MILEYLKFSALIQYFIDCFKVCFYHNVSIENSYYYLKLSKVLSTGCWILSIIVKKKNFLSQHLKFVTSIHLILFKWFYPLWTKANQVTCCEKIHLSLVRAASIYNKKIIKKILDELILTVNKSFKNIIDITNVIKKNVFLA